VARIGGVEMIGLKEAIDQYNRLLANPTTELTFLKKPNQYLSISIYIIFCLSLMESVSQYFPATKFLCNLTNICGQMNEDFQLLIDRILYFIVFSATVYFLHKFMFKEEKIQKSVIDDPLEDAYTPIRDAMIGNYLLEMKDFKEQNVTLVAKIEIKKSKAKKLIVKIYESNPIDIRGETLEAGFAIVGNDQIKFSFVIEEKINSMELQNKDFDYLIRLDHYQYDREGIDLNFDGYWHALSDLGGKFLWSGKCNLNRLAA
jgi:hypothetical protein